MQSAAVVRHPHRVRAERDEERLEELRELNRATKEATGEYMSEVGAYARMGSCNMVGTLPVLDHFTSCAPFVWHRRKSGPSGSPSGRTAGSSWMTTE